MIARLANNPVVANMLMLAFLLLGLICTLKMNRELFPIFSLDVINITAVYPGASADEVERTVIRKIEDGVIGLNNIKKVYSTSSEGFGSVIVQLEEGSTVRNVKDDIAVAIDKITTFPKEMERPLIKELVFEQNLIFLAVKGNLDPIAMKELSEELKNDLEDIKGVSKVEVAGTREYEVVVEIPQLTLIKYHLTLDQVSQKIRQESFDIPGGSVKTVNGEILIRGMNERNIGKQFGEIPIAVDQMGGQVLLKDIGTVKDELEENKIESFYYDTPTVLLQVFRKTESDAISTTKEILSYVKNRKNNLPASVEVIPWFDTSVFIQERIDLLLINGMQGFILVFLSLWLFMSFRLSFWVAMGIPTSFGGALIVMYLTGQTINMISLFALIMATGIIVDDAIVVGENIFTHLKMGKSRLQAAIDGTLEVALPVVGSMTTTVVAFLPMILMTGVFGKFMSVIPYAMIAILVTSLFECFFILPAHLAHSKVDGKLSKTRIWLNTSIDNFITRKYLPVFKITVKYRYVFAVAAICSLVLTVSIVKANIIKFTVFPEMDQFLLDVTYELEEGVPYEKTKEISDIIRKQATGLNEKFKDKMKTEEPLVKHVISFIGQHVGLLSKKGSNLGMTVIEISASDQRNIHSKEIVNYLRSSIGSLPGIKKISLGKAFSEGPKEKAIEINLQGENLAEMRIVSEKIAAELSKIENVIDVNTDYLQGKKEIQYELREDARLSGLDFSLIGSQIRNNFYGSEALRITRHGDEVKVSTRLPISERKSIGDLENSYYQNFKGEFIPFKEIVQFKINESPSQIKKVNGKTSIMVTSGVEKSGFEKIILQEFDKNYLQPLLKDSKTISYKLEGENEQTKESFGSLFKGYLFVALPLIYIILAAIFGSYFQPLIIMFVIPFGIIGAVLGHLIMGFELSMFSMIGIVALSGIVVNDSLVMVDFINRAVRSGTPLLEALLKAGEQRFRAIILTSLTTIAGLMPLLFETSLQAQIIIPMAISISFGLLAATVLTLLFMPVLYHLLEDIVVYFHKVFGKKT